jgi:hypothetical protein
MINTTIIEKAELNQLLNWLTDIEEAIEHIDKNVEEDPFGCLDQCKKVRKILSKMRGFLSVIKD